MKRMIPVLRNLHSPKKRSLPCTGQRNAILSFGRAGLVSDECSNTYETSYSEPDRSVTAKGHCSLPTYT